MLRILLALSLATAHAFIGPTQQPLSLALQQSQQPSEWDGFNPLAKSGGAVMIAMRKTQMNELTQEIMYHIDDDDKLQELMESSKDFLLDPLEQDFAVLDPDSIYEPGMDRAARYEKYRATMEERIEKASRGPLRKLLVTMRDYVLQFE